ncbi:MAG: ribonuclease D [Coriobacteriia bacterium]|nr:ribonuclease D [Coriobacteriia bacterium]
MYVRTTQELNDLVDALIGTPVLAVDTEFMREKTYWARLCLIQIGNSEISAIIDPLAIEDLSPLWRIMKDESTLKVLHAGQQDLEITWRLMGETVRPIFDTQIAATLAGFPQQVGYGAIVKELLGVELDKSDTYTDWAKRPLSNTQVEYALNDVRYLPEVYRKLSERLESHGRLPWLRADFERLESVESFRVNPEEMFRRLKRLSSLNRRQLGVLQKITAWRETEAQRRDIPRRWVLGDESLIEIARRCPKDPAELGAVRGVADKLPKSTHSGMIAAVKLGMEMPEEDLPRLDKRKRKPADIDGAVDLMAALVRLRAKQHDVAVPLMASRDDLERLAAGERDESPLLEGWRRSIVGDELLELLDGSLSLTLIEGALAVHRTMADDVEIVGIEPA